MLELCYYYAACLLWDLCYEKKYGTSATHALLSIVKRPLSETETPAERHQNLLNSIMQQVQSKADKTGFTIDRLDVLERLILPDHQQGDTTQSLKQHLLMGANVETELGTLFVSLSWSANKLELSFRKPNDLKANPYFEMLFKEDLTRIITQTKEFKSIQRPVYGFLIELNKLLFPHQQKTIGAWLPSLKP